MEGTTDRNEELLVFLHNTAEMGKDNLAELNGILKSSPMRELIERQMLEYKSAYDQTDRLLAAYDRAPRGDTMAKVMSKVMIGAKTLTDKSDKHIASMVIQGATLGVVDTVSKLNEYADCDDTIRNIGYKLLYVEQKSIDEMKHFL